jgi:hypothetical protein
MCRAQPSESRCDSVVKRNSDKFNKSRIKNGNDQKPKMKRREKRRRIQAPLQSPKTSDRIE